MLTLLGQFNAQNAKGNLKRIEYLNMNKYVRAKSLLGTHQNKSSQEQLIEKLVQIKYRKQRNKRKKNNKS